MKKMFCVVLAFIMLLPSFAALATTTEIGASIDSDWYNVYISGCAEAVQGVTVLLLNSQNQVGYITELDTDSEGNYETKFKFSKNINDYVVKVRDSESAEDITDSLNTAFARHELYGIDISLIESGNDVISYITEGGAAEVIANINNKYGNATNVSVLFAAYDENSKLIAIDEKSIDVEYEDINVDKTIDFSNVKLPAETKKVKAFVWENTTNLVPLATEDAKVTGTSLAFKNENPAETKVIGIIGDSITHWGHYTAFLYEYYATRYPDSNIVILNKGHSGDSGSGVISRLDWDIFSENDPLGYGACDEVTLMIGMNDSGYSTYTDGKMADEEYEIYYPAMRTRIDNCVKNIETIINYCLENGKGITLVTPSLYDESDRFVNTYPPVRYGSNYAIGQIAIGIRELGEKYDVPVLDLYKASNEYTDRIREEYPEATTVITRSEGIHPVEDGGYLFGYLFARAQETNTLVASVEINAANGSNKADNATVSDVKATSSSVSYTYLPKALPLYAGSVGYKYVKGYGVDIINNMNREIIKITNLDDGDYTISMDGTEIGTFSAQQLAEGVNIAELENNPGQIQAKNAFSYKETRRATENSYRSITNTEMYIRKNAKTSKYYPSDEGYDFDSFSNEDWIRVASAARAAYVADVGETTAAANRDQPFYGISSYIETNKPSEQGYIATIRECIDGIYNATRLTAHTVTISK